ncbi:MAG TPA: MarR family transcriptional regulator [Herpetosiphonaceae bacterium]|nr:MarR family transcriptional regulator [Herpetosiphonaceae bacterium]
MDRHHLDRLAEDLFTIAPQLHRLLDTEVLQQMDEGTSAAQLRLLTDLQQSPRSMSALARLHHVSPQAIDERMHDLIARGWVTRIPHPHDRRQQVLTLTEVGEAAVVKVRQHARAQVALLLLRLSDAELSIMAAAIPAFHRVLHEGGS